MRVYESKARKEHKTDSGEVVKVGEKYYWWKFNFDKTIHKSKTYPKPQQLTKSGFQIALYDIQDSIQTLEADENIGDNLQGIIDEISSLMDEQQSSLDNMPEHLQESSSSGQMLQERIDGLGDWVSELEGVNTDVDEPEEGDIIEEVKEEMKEPSWNEKSDEEIMEIIKDRVEEVRQEKLMEKYEEILSEIIGIEPSL